MEENLEELINCYYSDKSSLDFYKDSTNELNKKIKESMHELNVSEFVTNTGIVAKVTTQKRESFNEPRLIERLKKIDKSDAIDLVEVINWDKIEDMIYNGTLDASELAAYKEVKEVITLKVNKASTNKKKGD